MIKFFILLATMMAGVCFGDTHTAASSSQADFDAAKAAATYGDTISIPANTSPEIWNARDTITKGVFIIGPDSNSLTIETNVSGYLFVYKPDNTSIAQNIPFEISGFKFSMGSNSSFLYLKSTSSIPCTKIIIKRNSILNTGHYTVDVLGNFGGTISDNIITSGSDTPLQLMGNDSASWTCLPMKFGWDSSMYIENNKFYYSYSGVQMASSEGAYPWVFRYNDVNYSANAPNSILDAHGNLGKGNVYAAKGFEAYGNKITEAYGATRASTFKMRGGSHLVFFNKSNSTYGDPSDPQFGMSIYEEVIDSVNDTRGEYPTGTNQINGQPQHVSNNYSWCNYDGGGYRARYSLGPFCCSPTYSGCTDCGADSTVKNDREYFKYVSSFDGTTGVGAGTLANRPEMCDSGVGYFATNLDVSDIDDYVGNNPATPITGTLYVATAANTWSTAFSPAAFPHDPLKNSSTKMNNRARLIR